MKEFDSFGLEFDTYHICNDGGDNGAKMQALFKERGQNWQDPEIAKSNPQTGDDQSRQKTRKLAKQETQGN